MARKKKSYDPMPVIFMPAVLKGQTGRILHGEVESEVGLKWVAVRCSPTPSPTLERTKKEAAAESEKASGGYVHFSANSLFLRHGRGGRGGRGE